jgi:excinuclease UvrABC ATPase subunit
MDFWMETCNHEDDTVRKWACYNLPAMAKLFKEVQHEFHFDFVSQWKDFSQDEVEEIRYLAAASLHEAFALTTDEEDTTVLREVFIGYILDPEREMQQLMNKSVASMLHKYGNTHTVKTFKARTPHVEGLMMGDEKGESTPNGKQSDTMLEPSMHRLAHTKKLVKKNTSINIYLENLDSDPQEPKLAPIYVTEENKKEEVYSDLLQRLMVFVHNIRGTRVSGASTCFCSGIYSTPYIYSTCQRCTPTSGRCFSTSC